jgi:hypothetical protein
LTSVGSTQAFNRLISCSPPQAPQIAYGVLSRDLLELEVHFPEETDPAVLNSDVNQVNRYLNIPFQNVERRYRDVCVLANIVRRQVDLHFIRYVLNALDRSAARAAMSFGWNCPRCR